MLGIFDRFKPHPEEKPNQIENDLTTLEELNQELVKANNLEPTDDVLVPYSTEFSDTGEIVGLKFHPFQTFLTAITDISPISKLKNLTSLDIGPCSLTDLEPISGLENLQSFSWGGEWPHHREYRFSSPPDFSPLAGLTNLTSLTLHINDQLTNKELEALSNLRNLELLSLGGANRMTDLDPLSGLLKLENLNLTETGVEDLASLSNMKALRYLDASYTDVTDLIPLISLSNLFHLNLTKGGSEDEYNYGLEIGRDYIEDTEPLQSLDSLEILEMEAVNSALDLLPISHMNNLMELDVSYNKISSLAVLSTMENLLSLQLRGFQRLDDASVQLYLPQMVDRGMSIELGHTWIYDEDRGDFVELYDSLPFDTPWSYHSPDQGGSIMEPSEKSRQLFDTRWQNWKNNPYPTGPNYQSNG